MKVATSFTPYKFQYYVIGYLVKYLTLDNTKVIILTTVSIVINARGNEALMKNLFFFAVVFYLHLIP